MRIAKKKLPEMLLELGVITKEKLNECIKIQQQTGKNLQDILLEKKYITEEVLVETLSEQLQIPHIRVSNYSIPKEVLAEVPESLAKQYQVLPISVTGDILTLAMSNPLNILALDDIRMITGKEIEPVIAMPSELREVIERNYSGDRASELFASLLAEHAQQEELEEVKTVTEEVEDVSKVESVEEDEPVKKMARLIVLDALERGASDIHIEPFEKIIRVRYRVDGVLEEAKSPPKSIQSNLIARFKILSGCR
ncbi:MAG TPA: ATPase, T2SS/T4P/T4SS family, partial [Candidatus Hydrogenedens sp.]|nr:ATPase, T2SS/T4P/T4SS family [Candidatus Hydrogenedens sp.]